MPIHKKSSAQILTAEQIRENAKIIKNVLGRLGVDIKHGHALEAASAVAGYRDWNTAAATAPKHPSESHNCPVSFFDTHSVASEPIETSELVSASPIAMPELIENTIVPAVVITERAINADKYPHIRWCNDIGVIVLGSREPSATSSLVCNVRLLVSVADGLYDSEMEEQLNNIADAFNEDGADLHPYLLHTCVLEPKNRKQIIIYVDRLEQGDEVNEPEYIAWILSLGLIEALDHDYFGEHVIKIIWPFIPIDGEDAEKRKVRSTIQLGSLGAVCNSELFQMSARDTTVDLTLQNLGNGEILMVGTIAPVKLKK